MTRLHFSCLLYSACGAGTAADLDQVTKVIAGNMTLLELKTGESPYVINAVTRAKRDLFKYMGYVGAYLIIGGVDFDGVHLFNVHADGSTLQHSFVADGSGSLAAISVLEKEFKLDMSKCHPSRTVRFVIPTCRQHRLTELRSLRDRGIFYGWVQRLPKHNEGFIKEQEAETLVGKALMAGMESDLNSGNSYSYVVISKNRVFMKTDITPEFCRPQPQAIQFDLKPNTCVDSFVKVVSFANEDQGFLGEEDAKKMDVW
uniref:Uncharacterized protein n=1 Tax=Romanomermis culicivorax TaxID=13658 RepID=A0A915K8J6_ROMCU